MYFAFLGYTIDDLTGFGNLEQLFLNGRVDIEDVEIGDVDAAVITKT